MRTAFRNARPYWLTLLGLVGALSAQTPPPPTTSTTSGASTAVALARQAFEAYQGRDYLSVPLLLTRALEQVRQRQDKGGEAAILLMFAEAHNRVFLSPLADDYERKARELLKALPKDQAAEVLIGVGWFSSKANFQGRATTLIEEGVRLAQESGSDVSLTLAHLGAARHFVTSATERQKALEHAQLAVKHSRATQDKLAEATAIFYLSTHYSYLMQKRTALDHLMEARAALDAAPTPPVAKTFLEEFRQFTFDRRITQVRIMMNTGTSRVDLGEYAAGIAELERAVAFARSIPEPYYESLALISLGQKLHAAKEYDKARTTAGEALMAARKVNHRATEASALSLLASIAQVTGRTNQTVALAEQSLRASVDSGAVIPQFHALNGLASSLRQAGRFAESASNSIAAVAILDRTLASLGGMNEARMAVLSQNAAVYANLMECMFQLKRPEEAFAWSEQVRARVLLELMAAGKVDVNQGLTDKEREQDVTLRESLRAAQQAYVGESLAPAPDPAKLASLKSRLADAEQAFERFNQQLQLRLPAAGRRRTAQTLNVAETARMLPPDTALLSFQQVWTTVIDVFLVRAGTNGPVFRNHRFGKDAEELKELVDDLRASMSDPTRSYQAKAREAYRLLIGPMAPHLAGVKRLVICPDGLWWNVPFHALVSREGDRDVFLGEKFEIVYAYSATAAQAALRARDNPQRPKPAAELLVVANPDFGGAERFAHSTNAPPVRAIGAEARALGAEARAIGAEARTGAGRPGLIPPLPGTQVEADAIRSAFPTAKILTTTAAQESVLKAESGQYRFLHFATHGLFNEASPLSSSVVLARPADPAREDGFLTSREIFDLNWRADMVVFSACDTGRGKRVQGEGLVGLTWAAFVAGAPSQVVSQWAVNDASTAKLMAAFYQQLKAGKSRGAALQAASLELMKDGTHGHPYYWAPFILLGDWRN